MQKVQLETSTLQNDHCVTTPVVATDGTQPPAALIAGVVADIQCMSAACTAEVAVEQLQNSCHTFPVMEQTG